MQLVGFAVLALSWVVLVVGALNTLLEARRDRRLSAYVIGVRYLPSVLAMGTFRQLRGRKMSSSSWSTTRGRL